MCQAMPEPDCAQGVRRSCSNHHNWLRLLQVGSIGCTAYDDAGDKKQKRKQAQVQEEEGTDLVVTLFEDDQCSQ